MLGCVSVVVFVLGVAVDSESESNASAGVMQAAVFLGRLFLSF